MSYHPNGTQWPLRQQGRNQYPMQQQTPIYSPYVVDPFNACKHGWVLAFQNSQRTYLGILSTASGSFASTSTSISEVPTSTHQYPAYRCFSIPSQSTTGLGYSEFTNNSPDHSSTITSARSNATEGTVDNDISLQVRQSDPIQRHPASPWPKPRPITRAETASVPQPVLAVASSSHKFECTVCHKIFDRKSRMDACRNRHSSVKPHKCLGHCGYSWW